MLQRESIKRLDRLNMVVSKMKEVREQRQTLLIQLQDEMNQEDKEAAAAGQDDAEFLGELGGCKVDVMVAVKKRLKERYGKLVRIIMCYYNFININITNIKFSILLICGSFQFLFLRNIFYKTQF